jgi:hypothetical protein
MSRENNNGVMKRMAALSVYVFSSKYVYNLSASIYDFKDMSSFYLSGKYLKYILSNNISPCNGRRRRRAEKRNESVKACHLYL